MDIKQIIILGSGGNCIDILDTIHEINRNEKKYECLGFLDDDETKWGARIYGKEVLGGLGDANKYENAVFVNGIGSPNNYWKKASIINKTGLSPDRFETIIHPSASVSGMSRLGHGCVVLQHVTIASNVTVGDHVMILPNSVINHDDAINDYTIVASGVCIAGGVTIGKSCYLGSNASIIGYTNIESEALIGMGSVVLNHVAPRNVVAGNPAKVIRVLETE